MASVVARGGATNNLLSSHSQTMTTCQASLLGPGGPLNVPVYQSPEKNTLQQTTEKILLEASNVPFFVWHRLWKVQVTFDQPRDVWRGYVLLGLALRFLAAEALWHWQARRCSSCSLLLLVCLCIHLHLSLYLLVRLSPHGS